MTSFDRIWTGVLAAAVLSILGTAPATQYEKKNSALLALRALGEEVAKRHPGAKVVVVVYEKGYSERRWKEKMDALGEALSAGKCAIVKVIETKSLEDESYQRIVSDLPDDALIVMPSGFIWKSFEPEVIGNDGPPIAFIGTHRKGTKEALLTGRLAVWIRRNDGPFIINVSDITDSTKTQQEVYRRLFLLVTKENHRGLVEEYPKLFSHEVLPHGVLPEPSPAQPRSRTWILVVSSISVASLLASYLLLRRKATVTGGSVDP